MSAELKAAVWGTVLVWVWFAVAGVATVLHPLAGVAVFIIPAMAFNWIYWKRRKR